MFKILLDAGHGAGRAHNRGGTCYNEGDNNYYYSLVLKKELEKIKGVKVDLTRKKISDNPSLSSRAAKGAGYDLFLSIHSNGANASVRGTEIWDNVQNSNKSLADKLTKEIASLFNHPNRGTRYRKNSSGGNYYGVLRGNRAKSSMIIEHGFHSNSIDCSYFKNNHVKIAKVTAEIIRNHYNLGGEEVVQNMYYHRTHNNKHPRVKKLQEDLNLLGYDLTVDTNFGPATEKAIRDYQKKNDLTVNGIADTATLRHIMYKTRNIEAEKKAKEEEKNNPLYKVQVGAYSKKNNAKKKLDELKKKGEDGFIKKE